MIKIIKSGNTRKEITCDKCYCMFSYTAKDIENYYTSDRYVHEVTCPECGRKNQINIQE